MLYILFSDSTVNLQPENGYGSGTTMQFKQGLFLFDTDETKSNYWERDNSIEIDSTRYRIKDNLKFKSRKRAEIIYLRMKIDEMKENGMSFFFPTKFNKLIKNFEKLIEENPEYAI